MVSFDSETIYNAWRNLNSLDAKVGGMFCILSCIDEEIVPNKSYKIDGVKLRQKLSYVFDKDAETKFSTQQANFIIFAKNWYTTFFDNEIKNKIDLLSCAVFFLRRNNFVNEKANQEIIEKFLDDYHLSKYKDVWFSNNLNLNVQYANNDSEINQKKFYSQLSNNSFCSITFNSTLQKHAYDLSAAGHIQTLYSAKGILKTCIFSNEPLDSYYIMQNMGNANKFPSEKENQAQHDSSSLQSLTPAEQYEQLIIYGVPGSGKSFKIDNEKTNGASDFQKQKVVFHPDYTNSDFIGQIIPKMKEIEEDEKKKSVIEYSFKPGPFTTILRRALRDKDHQYYLIIEEINRGNAAAIFGDLFQLLDRDENGWSCSPVNNDDINYYVASKNEFWEEGYKDIHEYNTECVNHPVETESFCRNSGLRLPPNLSIYATMNTNDQNVFTLDNAFNRRFKSEYISNKADSKVQAHCDQYNLEIGKTEVLWGMFRNQIK